LVFYLKTTPKSLFKGFKIPIQKKLEADKELISLNLI